MNHIYTKNFTVGTTQVDLFDHCSPGTFLQVFQDIATEHAAILNFGRDYLVEHYHACWIIARVWYRLNRPIMVGETVTIHTWHRGAQGFTVNRDFDLYVGEEYVGEAVEAWVVADIENRKMLRPSKIETLAAAIPPETVKDIRLMPIRCPGEKQPVYERTVRYSDLDLNGHMNNTKYADVLMDAMTVEEMQGRFVSEFQLNYSKECMPLETMTVCRVLNGDSCYIDGMSADGERRFEATLQFSAYSGNHLDEA